MPSSIKPEDKPVHLIVDQDMSPTMYAVVDAHGTKRAFFVEKEDAEEFELFANAPEVTLMQSNMRDTGIGRSPERRAKPKGKSMPRGIPKKKSKKSVKKAAVVKKSAKKTMKRRKRRV